MSMNRILRRAAAPLVAAALAACAGCGGHTTAAPAEAREGGGTPTLFDNPPLGDPLAPSQADLDARRPARKVAAPRR